MNKQEAIRSLQEMAQESFEVVKINAVHIDNIMEVISQLDEPEKPVVPQFVADWYEEHKWDFEWNLYKFCFGFHERKLHEDLHEWFKFDKNKPIETLILMHKFGYEVEKEKRYTVEIPNPNRPDIATFLYKENGKVFIGNEFFWDEVPNYKWKNEPENHLTESEIKKDFDWLWQFAEEVK